VCVCVCVASDKANAQVLNHQQCGSFTLLLPAKISVKLKSRYIALLRRPNFQPVNKMENKHIKLETYTVKSAFLL
jgi:hypothetical protein